MYVSLSLYIYICLYLELERLGYLARELPSRLAHKRLPVQVEHKVLLVQPQIVGPPPQDRKQRRAKPKSRRKTAPLVRPLALLRRSVRG